MCLYSKSKFPKRAKKDIICYKILEKPFSILNPSEYYKSICQDTLIDIDKPYKGKFNSISHIIPKKIANFLYQIKDGYIHCITTLYRARSYKSNISNWCIFKCIIPKGTLFYMGEYSDICAKKLNLLNE